MRLVNLITQLVKSKMRSIAFFTSMLLILAASSCVRAEPKEVIWWKDMYVAAMPIRDKEGAIFAIQVVLTNRAQKDVALFRKAEPLSPTFDVSLIAGQLNAKILTIQRVPPEIPRTPPPERDVVEMAPGASVSFCVKMESYLPTTTVLDPKSTYLLAFDVMGSLAWKRSAGYTTPFSYENESQRLANKYFFGPRIEFGQQKISVQRNRGCA